MPGSPGSTYDAARNPAKANGAASYDPTSALTPHDYGNGGHRRADGLTLRQAPDMQQGPPVSCEGP